MSDSSRVSIPAAHTVVLVGPTAGGKTALALALARRLGSAEIVSADSMQVYRGMDIGTAKPSLAERGEVPHHLIDCADPHAGDFTMAEWIRRARAAISEIHGRQRVAIVAGGTNLYVRALLEGVAETPLMDAALRHELAALSDDAARAELQRIDATTANRVHPHDRRRTLRAIELHRLTGRPPSELRDQWSDAPQPLPVGVTLVGLEWEVAAINSRINERVRRMFADGLVDEVRGLLAGGPLTRQAIEAVGYREVAEHLGGRMSIIDALEQTKIRSRRLGKAAAHLAATIPADSRVILDPGGMAGRALRLTIFWPFALLVKTRIHLDGVISRSLQSPPSTGRSDLVRSPFAFRESHGCPQEVHQGDHASVDHTGRIWLRSHLHARCQDTVAHSEARRVSI